MEIRFIIVTITGSLMIIYAIYCMSLGGTHIKGKGWVSKQEAPKSYFFNQALYFILGLILIFGKYIR